MVQAKTQDYLAPYIVHHLLGCQITQTHQNIIIQNLMNVVLCLLFRTDCLTSTFATLSPISSSRPSPPSTSSRPQSSMNQTRPQGSILQDLTRTQSSSFHDANRSQSSMIQARPLDSMLQDSARPHSSSVHDANRPQSSIISIRPQSSVISLLPQSSILSIGPQSSVTPQTSNLRHILIPDPSGITSIRNPANPASTSFFNSKSNAVTIIDASSQHRTIILQV